MENRNKVFVTRSVHKTTDVINYSGRSDVNSFLGHFDVWGGNGHMKICRDEQHCKFLFECGEKFIDFCKTEDFKHAFRSMGVEIVFDYEDVADID